MPIVQPGSGDIPEVAAGLYTFKIIETKADVRQDDTFGKAGDPVLAIYCQLADTDDGEGEEIVLRPIVSLKFSQGGKYQPSTLYLYAKAAGVLPKEGFPFDTDLLEGRVLMGMVQQEEGKWPRIEPKSLMPVKAMAGKPVPMSQKAQEAPSEGATPFDTDDVVVDSLEAWSAKLRAIGYTPTEIAGHSRASYDRTPDQLTPIEREELAKSLGV